MANYGTPDVDGFNLIHFCLVGKSQVLSLQLDENIKLTIRRYEKASSEPEKSPTGDGRSLKPETPEPDGDSNQERVKDRGWNKN